MSRKQPPAAPPAPPVVPAPEPLVEEPIIPMVGMEKANGGGYVVISIEIQGNRVISRKLHLVKAESKDYAASVFKTVAMRKIFYRDRSAVVNLED